MKDDSWSEYYNRKKREPRASIKRALAYFQSHPKPNNHAVDVGCGDGADTQVLLLDGWRVHSIDSSLASKEIVLSECPLNLKDKLEFDCQSFDTVAWKPTGLVNASLSLPFCSVDTFDLVLGKITASIVLGGVFTGNFFGERDDWKDLALVTESELLAIFADFEISFWEEREYSAKSIMGPEKNWHIFEIMAIKSDI